MTKVRFTGFADNATVEIAVTKEIVTKGPLAISAWKQQDDIDDKGSVGNLEISMLREPSITAPEHVRFSANVLSETGLPVRTNGDVGTATYDVYDQQMHELDFVWTFSHPTNPQPDEPLFQKSSRLPASWRSKNKAFGKHAAHIFEKAGEYTITCEAWRVDYDDQANTQLAVLVGRNSTTITVDPVADTYAGAQTICFDPDGNADEAPTGAVVYADWADYQANWSNDGGDSTKVNRFLFRRGKTHVIDSPKQTGRPNMTFGAYGTGARPIIDVTGLGERAWTALGSNAAGPLGYWRFLGLDVRGGWDDANEIGTRDSLIECASPVNLVLFDCLFDGVDRAAYTRMASTGAETECSVWFYDSDCVGFRDYGLQCATNDNQWIILRGSRVMRSLDAAGEANAAGKDNDDPRNWHGPVRIAYLNVGIFQASDFYSRSSWGLDAPAQSNWRVGSEGGTKPWSLVAVNNVLEGGGASVSTSTEGDGQPIYPANILFKHNITIADFSTGSGIALARGATSVVENMFIFPDLAKTTWDSSEAALTTNPNRRVRSGGWSQKVTDNDFGTNRQEPMRIIGNINIDLKDPFNSEDVLGSNEMTMMRGLVDIRDNVTYAPLADTPITQHGPMETALTIASYNTYGGRWQNKFTGTYHDFTQDQDGKTMLTPNGQVDVLRPQIGQGVAASGPQSKFDVLGMERSPATTAGAIEAAD